MNNQRPDRNPCDCGKPEPLRLCLSMDEAGAAIGVSGRQVYNLRALGLPTVLIGGRRLVRVDDLRQWLAALPVDEPPAGGEQA